MRTSGAPAADEEATQVAATMAAEREASDSTSGATLVATPSTLLRHGVAKCIDISQRHKFDAGNRIVRLNARARVCASTA